MAKRARGRDATTNAATVQACVSALNECVGVSVRRAFRRQLHPSPSSGGAIHCQLPELTQFVASLQPTDADAAYDSHAARSAFADPQAQWLGRSARESGVTALLSRQLVQLARDHRDNADTVALVLSIFLDALFTPCMTRLGARSRACEWKHRKPTYPAMPCALVWSALLPLVELLALEFPRQFADQLETQYSIRLQRVNCVFAQVAGIWTLLEALHTALTKATSSADAPVDDALVIEMMQRLVRFTVRVKLLGVGAHNGSFNDGDDEQQLCCDGKGIDHVDFGDLVMDKFFVELQAFTFSCSRSQEVVGTALRTALSEVLVEMGDEQSASASKALLFSASSCIFVKDLADSLVTALIDKSRENDSCRRRLRRLLVGLAAHFDRVGVSAVLEVLLHLASGYEARDGDNVAFLMVYVAVHRRDVARAANVDATSKRSPSYARLLHFQDTICGRVDPRSFRTVPLEWMRIFWQEWINLLEEDVASFVSLCQDTSESDLDDSPLNRQEIISSIPFRVLDTRFALASAQLQPHCIAPLALDDDAPDAHSRLLKRRHTGANDDSRRKIMRELDPAKEELKLSVLLLPEVMERVCSFMSAKRLCRMASVCRAFADVSQRQTLWKALWFRLIANEADPVVCRHGSLYTHDWTAMYRARVEARRKLPKKTAKKAHRDLDHFGATHQTDSADDPSTDEFPARLCSRCDCHTILTSRLRDIEHGFSHEKYSCEEPECGASFGAMAKLHQHRNQAHPGRRRAATASSKLRIPCGHEGCSKTYVSLKRLETHRRQHDQTPPS